MVLGTQARALKVTNCVRLRPQMVLARKKFRVWLMQVLAEEFSILMALA